MRPLRLVVEGLRSYRGRQEIAFEEVGLFAITGPTGAGKSSILEALVFALYHASTFDKSNVKALISDGCEDMTVSLTFRARGGVWQVTRSLSRLASRPPVHELRTPDGTLLDKKKDVDEAVTEVLGLACDDFLKTVVLPQGKFQALLHSKPGERAPLLKSLLGLDELDQLAEAVASQRERLKEALNRARGLRAGLAPAGDPEALEKELGELSAIEEKLASALGACQQMELELRRQGEQVEAHQARLRKLNELAVPDPEEVERLRRLESGLKEELAAADGALAAAREAVSALEEELRERAAQGLDRAGLERRREALVALEQLGPQVQAIRRERAEVEQQLEERRREADALSEVIAHSRAALEQVVEEGRHARDAVETARKVLDERRAALHRARERKAALDRLVERLGTRRGSAATLEEERVRLAAELEAADARLKDATSALGEVERANRAAAACHDLHPGEACPVCTRELPPDWSPPLEGGLDEAQQRVQEGREAVQKSRTELARNRADAAAAEREIAQLEEEAKALTASLEEFELSACDTDLLAPDETTLAQAEEVRTRLQERYVQLKSEQQGRESELKGLVTATAETTRRLERLGVQQEKLEGRLAECRVSLGDEEPAVLRAGLEEASARVEDLETRHKQALRDVSERHNLLGNLQQRRRTEVEEPRRRLENQLRTLAVHLEAEAAEEAELAAWSGALQARRAAELERLDKEVRELAQAREQLADSLTKALRELDCESSQQAEAVLNAARERRIGCQQALRATREALEKARELDEALVPGQQLERALDFLHGTLGNRRTRGGASFAQWLLERRQRELLEIASLTFAELTGGQYGFSTDFGVVDRGTGQARKPNTLSGGESFLASLSLALSLSEMVGRRGGRLEAFFLDEGFGSLSPECLDRALDALEGLAQSGRLIGLISHVPAVAERIETVWRVERTPDGSRVHVLEPAAVEPATPELLQAATAALTAPPSVPVAQPGLPAAPPRRRGGRKKAQLDPEQQTLFAEL